jgi:hypothetical protein
VHKYTVFIIYRLCPNIDCVCIYKGCLKNKRTVCATQHNAQVIWRMPHGCLYSYLTVSQVCFYHVCRSSVAVGKAARWSLLEYLYKVLTFTCPLHWPKTNDSHSATSLDCRGMWKILPLKLMQLLTCGHCRVQSGTVTKNNNSTW